MIANAMVLPWVPAPNNERHQEQGSRAKHSRVTCTFERSLDFFIYFFFIYFIFTLFSHLSFFELQYYQSVQILVTLCAQHLPHVDAILFETLQMFLSWSECRCFWYNTHYCFHFLRILNLVIFFFFFFFLCSIIL